ncbi:hypothetical protein MKW98_025269 [Papaver atlanticum]|uniref:Uncharacterized protein n=1 Tax=Papaver atlanticum TaxID=357466 RepID=A0AAD4S239_9MAGN|nr:hypothetical protein MKW98_025269 [Papaver atlanticum]
MANNQFEGRPMTISQLSSQGTLTHENFLGRVRVVFNVVILSPLRYRLLTFWIELNLWRERRCLDTFSSKDLISHLEVTLLLDYSMMQ